MLAIYGAIEVGGVIVVRHGSVTVKVNVFTTGVAVLQVYSRLTV